MSETEHRGVEYADTHRPRGFDTFPEAWGIPEGRAFSPEREAWIQRHIPAVDSVVTALRRMAARDARMAAALRLIGHQRVGP